MALFRFPKRRLRKLIQQGEYEKAMGFGNSLEPKFSRDTDFLFIMGSMYYMVGDAQRALHYFDRSLRIEPDDVETLHLKANVHLHLEEHGAALECCRRILAKDPGHREASQIADALDGEGGAPPGG